MTTVDIARLTPKERLDLIGELWDSLAPEDVSLTPAQEAELARRMATFEADAEAAAPWDRVEADFERGAATFSLWEKVPGEAGRMRGYGLARRLKLPRFP
jgi:putative addiction module component (TIGR02574 family)